MARRSPSGHSVSTLALLSRYHASQPGTLARVCETFVTFSETVGWRALKTFGMSFNL